MTSYTIKILSPLPFDETVAAAREELAESGFGVLTEIDVQATLKTKIDVDREPLLILGACKPQFAHRVLAAEPSIAALLPCNVVVRQDGTDVIVEAFNPAAMTAIGGTDLPAEVHAIAESAQADISAALERLAARPAAIAVGQ